MTPKTAPTALELRAYALGHLDREAGTEIERYLLLSGDERAMRLVSAFTRARLRVEAYDREAQAASWMTMVLERLGAQVQKVLESAKNIGLELLSQPLIGATLGPRSADLPGSRVRYHIDGDARYLHVLVADVEGQWSVLYPDDGRAQKPERSTPELPLPVAVQLAVGIASTRPLFTSVTERLPPIQLEQALGRLGLTLQDVALSSLEIADEEQELTHG